MARGKGDAVKNYTYDPENLTLFDKNGSFNTFRSDKRNDAFQAELDRQFQRNERIATQDWELEIWNKNNEYNSPLEQLKRYKEAGINPNAMNGSSPVASSQLNSTPSSGRGTAPSHEFGDTMSLIGNLDSIANTSFSALKSVAEKKNIESQTNLNSQEYAYNNATFDERVNAANLEVKRISEDINKSISSQGVDKSQSELNYASSEQIRSGIPYIARKNEAEIDLMLEEAKLNRQKIENLKTEQSELKKTGQYERGLMNAQASYYQEQGNLAASNANVATATEDERIAKEQYESSLLKIKKEFSSSIGCPTDASEFGFFWYLHENDLFDQYVTEVQGAMSKEIAKRTVPIQKGFDSGGDLVRDVLFYLMLLGGKGKPPTVKGFR